MLPDKKTEDKRATSSEKRIERLEIKGEKALRAYIILIVFMTFAVYVSGYQSHAELVQSQRRGCARGIKDRLDDIKVQEAAIVGNEAIAADPQQTTRTRIARLHQANVEKEAIIDIKTRVNPYHGGLIVCSQIYPQPSIVPFISWSP